MRSWAAARIGLAASTWTNQVTDWMLVAALTFPLAWLSWTRIERPAMRWARGPRTARHALILRDSVVGR